VQWSVVTGDLPKTWPGGTRRDILGTATRTPHSGADLRYGKGRSKLGDEARRFDDRIVTAAIAPAKDIDPGVGNIAQAGRLSSPFLGIELMSFHPSHG